AWQHLDRPTRKGRCAAAADHGKGCTTPAWSSRRSCRGAVSSAAAPRQHRRNGQGKAAGDDESDDQSQAANGNHAITSTPQRTGHAYSATLNCKQGCVFARGTPTGMILKQTYLGRWNSG